MRFFLDSLFLVEIVNDEIIEIGQISTEPSPVARLTASNRTISIYEGRSTLRGGSEIFIAKFHQLSLSLDRRCFNKRLHTSKYTTSILLSLSYRNTALFLRRRFPIVYTALKHEFGCKIR